MVTPVACLRVSWRENIALFHPFSNSKLFECNLVDKVGIAMEVQEFPRVRAHGTGPTGDIWHQRTAGDASLASKFNSKMRSIARRERLVRSRVMREWNETA